MHPRVRRFLRHWAFSSAIALAVAAFAYSPYAFPEAIAGDALALAYQTRYVFLMSTLWTLGPAGSLGEFAGKLFLTIVLLWGLAPALLGLLLPVARRR
ncbi:MAG TPA: hypothetical protein VK043_03530 [Burkholderiales bacterium]|nr:hypothetical protein [Burkholderiales bacterium]